MDRKPDITLPLPLPAGSAGPAAVAPRQADPNAALRAADPYAALRAERDRFVALAFAAADLLLELDGEQRVLFAAGATAPFTGLAPTGPTCSRPLRRRASPAKAFSIWSLQATVP